MKRAKEVFFAGASPAPVSTDDVYADDHPLVLRFPDLFVDVHVIEAPGRSRDVEQATAAPGERRGARRG